MTAEYDSNDVPEPKSPGTLIDHFDIRTPLLILCILCFTIGMWLADNLVNHIISDNSPPPILLGLALFVSGAN